MGNETKWSDAVPGLATCLGALVFAGVAAVCSDEARPLCVAAMVFLLFAAFMQFDTASVAAARPAVERRRSMRRVKISAILIGIVMVGIGSVYGFSAMGDYYLVYGAKDKAVAREMIRTDKAIRSYFEKNERVADAVAGDILDDNAAVDDIGFRIMLSDERAPDLPRSFYETAAKFNLALAKLFVATRDAMLVERYEKTEGGS